MSERTPIALTIAGSDSGAGAGIQADLKTLAALGVYAACVVTAVTAQNTKGVRAVHFIPAETVRAQIEAVMEDFAVAAIKVGMLGNAEIVEAVADLLPSPVGRGVGGEGARAEQVDDFRPEPSSGAPRHLLLRGEGKAGPWEDSGPFVVYDPVMAASSGDALSGVGFIEAVRSKLLPRVDCLTPNLAESAALLGESSAGTTAEMARQGKALLMLGPRAALMKGGHLEGPKAVDLLVAANGVHRFASQKLASKNLHGTGCTLSSAIAAFLVRGEALPEAVRLAKAFVSKAIARGSLLRLGSGAGPLIQSNLFARR